MVEKKMHAGEKSHVSRHDSFKELEEVALIKVEQILQRLKEQLSATQVNEIAMSLCRTENVYGVNVSELDPTEYIRFLQNVFLDYQSTRYKIILFEDIKLVKETIDEISYLYQELTTKRSENLIELSTAKTTLSDAELEKIVINFLRKRMKSFFSDSETISLFSAVNVHLYIKDGTRFQLRHQLKRRIQESNQNAVPQNASENTFSQSITSWYEIAQNVSLNLFFQQVSLLETRQQLSLFFRFGYLDSQFPDIESFCHHYKISKSTYVYCLKDGLDLLIMNVQKTEQKAWNTVDSIRFIKRVKKLESQDLLRYKEGIIIDKGVSIFRLAKLISEEGESLLDAVLSHQQHAVLYFLIQYFKEHQSFPKESEVGEAFGIERISVSGVYDRILLKLFARSKQ